jgi:carbon storage regulator
MMLVLSRKVGQRIVLGPDIEVTVVQIRGQRVRVGVTAPREVSVNRLELRKRGADRLMEKSAVSLDAFSAGSQE